MSHAEEWSARLSRHDPVEAVATFCRREEEHSEAALRGVESSLRDDRRRSRCAPIEALVVFDTHHLRAVVEPLQ